jgi:hypothetical protein
MDKVFVIVMGSFDLPIYTEMIKIRINQFRKRNINFHFLINGDVPTTIDLAKNEYTNQAYVDYKKDSMSLIWIVKSFQKVLQDLYGNIESEKYDYVLLVNASTFINFDAFVILLNDYLPKKELFAGRHLNYEGTKSFVSGVATILSKDVAKAYAYETDIDLSKLFHAEDVAISHLLMDRYMITDIFDFFSWIIEFSSVPTMEELNKRINNHYVFYRVKNDAETVDKRFAIYSFIWHKLHERFN